MSSELRGCRVISGPMHRVPVSACQCVRQAVSAQVDGVLNVIQAIFRYWTDAVCLALSWQRDGASDAWKARHAARSDRLFTRLWRDRVPRLCVRQGWPFVSPLQVSFNSAGASKSAQKSALHVLSYLVVGGYHVCQSRVPTPVRSTDNWLLLFLAPLDS